MLVLRRKCGQWVEITHRSGDVLRVRVSEPMHGRVDLVFDDDRFHFRIEREERPEPVAKGVTDR